MSDLPDNDRRASPVSSGKRWLQSRKAMLAAGSVVALTAAGLFVMGIHSALNDNGPQKQADTGLTAIAQVTQTPPTPPPPREVALPEPRIVYVSAPPATAVSAPAIVAAPVNSVQFPAHGTDSFFDVPAPVAHEDKAVGGGAAQHAADPPRTEVAFKPSTLAGGKAGPAIRLTYVMMPQMIPCALTTAMDSTLSGSIECHTTQDVLSPDHILLMPAGTLIVGTYQNNVRNGQRRLFAFAGSAITKEGIPVPLDSAIGDSLGRGGIPGDVDNHYGERFGAALLLTAAQAGASILQTEVSKQGQTSLNLNSGGGVEGIAGQILQSQINIPATISVPPGTIVSIVVDHPIDFSDAIKVTTR